MEFEFLRDIPGSLERARALYERVFTREAGRLEGEALWLERRTTLHVLGQELGPGSRVLDLGCGAGVYALPLAAAGHRVTAADLVPAHIEQLKARAAPGMALEAVCRDAQGVLDETPDGAYDTALCLGPMYHLREREERVRLLAGCARAVKPGGRVLAAFINNDWVIASMTLTQGGHGYILTGDYDKETFRCEDFPLVFHTLEQADGETGVAGLRVLRRVNADGLNEIMQGDFGALTPEERDAWFRFHLYLCEQPQHLGACNHWLYVCEPL